MRRAQKRDLEEQEISRRKALARAIRKQEAAGKIDIKGTFELMYLSFVRILEDRELVEDDLKELKSMLDACADRMVAIMKKSGAKNARKLRESEPS